MDQKATTVALAVSIKGKPGMISVISPIITQESLLYTEITVNEIISAENLSGQIIVESNAQYA